MVSAITNNAALNKIERLNKGGKQKNSQGISFCECFPVISFSCCCFFLLHFYFPGSFMLMLDCSFHIVQGHFSSWNYTIKQKNVHLWVATRAANLAFVQCLLQPQVLRQQAGGDFESSTHSDDQLQTPPFCHSSLTCPGCACQPILPKATETTEGTQEFFSSVLSKIHWHIY